MTVISVGDIDIAVNDRKTFDPDAIATLAASIAEDGLLSPILVRVKRNGRYELVAGERRLRAVKSLGWDSIEATPTVMDDRTASRVMLVENGQRVNLDPIEEAIAFQERRDQGWSDEEIAASGFWSVGVVRSRIALLRLSDEIRQAIGSGTLWLSFGQMLVGLDSDRQHAAYTAFANDPAMTLPVWRALVDELRDAQDRDAQQGFGFEVEEMVERAVKRQRVGRVGLCGLLREALPFLEGELAERVEAALESNGQ